VPLFEVKVSCSDDVYFCILEAESLIAAHIRAQEKIDELNRRIRAKLPEAEDDYATIIEVSRCYKVILTDEEIDRMVEEAEYIEDED